MSFEPEKHVHNMSAQTAMDIDVGLQDHMRKVYNVMCLGLIVTGLAAFAVSQIEPLFQLIYTTPLKWVAMFGPLLFLWFGFSPARVARKSSAGVQFAFTLFSALMGVSMSYIFKVYAGADIMRVFFITSGMFAGVSLYGYTTKKDLSGVGSFMIMGLIGLIIASLVNLFLQSTAMHFITSVLGVIIFTGLTAWDTQRIKETYHMSYGREEMTKFAVLGALSLYLNFVLLFQHLLSLFGGSQD